VSLPPDADDLCCGGLDSSGLQRLLEVLDQVRSVLDADGKSDELRVIPAARRNGSGIDAWLIVRG
jgi:hypothetical protein